MKKQFYIILLCAAIFATSFKTFAQVQVLEKSYEVSKKARKGNLSAIDFNDEKGTIELIYVLPDKLFAANKIQSEIYTYNKDLELVSTDKIEIPTTKLRKGKSTIKEDISYVTVDASPGILSFPTKVVFKKKEVARRFNWFTMRYEVSEKLLDKITPKSEDGDKYNYFNKHDVLQDKSVLVIAGKHKKKTSNLSIYYDIMRCDIDGNVKVTDSLNFTRPYYLFYSSPVADENELDEFELTRDWIMVFAPALNKTFEAVKPTMLTYVRVSPAGKILERFEFDSPSNRWEINYAFEKNGSVYLSGPAITKDRDKKYHSELYKSKGAQYTNIQICKLTKGKVDFISSPAIKDFAANLSKPVNQKKAVPFDGKSIKVGALIFNENGDIMVPCQDGIEKQFNNNYMFQFDSNGNFKKCYNVTLTADTKKAADMNSFDYWAKPITNYFLPSQDGKSTYWLMRSTKFVKCESSVAKNADGTAKLDMMGQTDRSRSCEGYYHFDVCSINNTSGELSDLKILGHEKKDEFYLFPAIIEPVRLGNFIFTAAESLKGDKIMLSRIDVSK